MTHGSKAIQPGGHKSINLKLPIIRTDFCNRLEPRNRLHLVAKMVVNSPTASMSGALSPENAPQTRANNNNPICVCVPLRSPAHIVRKRKPFDGPPIAVNQLAARLAWRNGAAH